MGISTSTMSYSPYLGRQTSFCIPRDKSEILSQIAHRYFESKKYLTPSSQIRYQITTPPLVQTAVKTNQVMTDVIPRSYLLTGDAAPKFLYVAGDLSSLSTNIHNFIYAVQFKPVPHSLYMLSGATSSVSVITGGYTMSNGYVAHEEASGINDLWGKISAKFTMAYGVLEALGGMIFIPTKALSFTAGVTGVKTFAVAIGVLSTVGSVVFAGMYGLLMVPSAIALKSNIQLRSAFNKVFGQDYTSDEKKHQAAIEFLTNRLKLSDEERETLLANVPEKASAEEEFQSLTSSDLAWVESKASSPQQIPLLKTAYANALKRKEVMMGRAVGGETVKLVKAEIAKPLQAQITHRLQVEGESANALDEAKAIISKFFSESTKNRILQVAIILACLVGTAAFIAGIFLTGGASLGAPLIVLTVASIAVSVGMLGIDGYCLYQSYKTDQPNFKEKLAMFVAMALLLTALVATMVFTGGIALYITVSVIAVLWIALATYSYRKWKNPPINN